MGHATRSKVSIAYLTELGHEVLVATSGRVFPVIKRAHPRTIEIVGIGSSCTDGRLDLRKTLEDNARRLPAMLDVNSSAWWAVAGFCPQAVVTDYDSFSYLFGKAHDLPVVSIDNFQILPRCEHDDVLLASQTAGIAALRAFSSVITPPDCHHYIVTTFFFPDVVPGLESTTTLVPPILRPEVLARLDAPPEQKEHVLVYKTESVEDDVMLRALGSTDASFRLYGMRPETEVPDNCVNCPFDESAFVDDLASSRAVISNGGMSLTGEAVAFGKPVYAVPMRDQYEQVLNARYIEHMRFGGRADTLTTKGIAEFLTELPDFEKRLRSSPQHDSNRRLYAALEGLFGRAANASDEPLAHAVR
jgi:uncharacterized protein (TIGR00661 family)